ncbi:P-loop containing nucleoside triphosphate hydrolase protein [Xylariaceae sp. FL0016]|nr:P-loop containing nucleoside triphosphate hydrolase protein [Xylariaceae sp. FL0016]
MAQTADKPHCPIVFVLGPPGSGKGTLCKRMTEGHPDLSGSSFYHLSVGDYLRELCDPAIPSAHENLDRDSIRFHLRENVLLPSEVLIPILDHKINSTLNSNGDTTTWLVDGFPRNTETLLAFEQKLERPMKVIILECTRDSAKERFLAHRREGADNENRFNKRYDEYVENMKGIREYYAPIIQSAQADADIAANSKVFAACLKKP